MSTVFDPNAPDCTNGDFFCVLCLASMNSESMWSSHIAGRRHIKNAIKYPNGLPKRKLTDDEDSYDRPAKHERYDDDYQWGDNYSPPYDYYGDDYYNGRPPPPQPLLPPATDYVPAIKPNVVIDYGHRKTFEDKIPPPEPKHIQAAPPIEKVTPPSMNVVSPSMNFIPSIRNPSPPNSIIPPGVDLDEILNEIVNKDAKKKEKDDFFEKINQREIAKDIASEIRKKCLFREPTKSDRKDSKTEASDVHEKHSKRKSSDIFDILHKHNDEKLFKISNDDDSKKRSSSPMKIPEKPKSKPNLKDFDPDELSPDAVDDLLSARLKQKSDKSSTSKENSSQKHNVTNKASLDDFKLISEKLEILPTMAFLQLTLKKMKSLELKNTEELAVLVKIVSEAQEYIRNKLPPNLQAVVNASISEYKNKKAQAPVQGTPVSLNNSIAPISVPKPAPISTPIPAPKPAPISASIPSPNHPLIGQRMPPPKPPPIPASILPRMPTIQNQTPVSISQQIPKVAVSQSQVSSYVPQLFLVPAAPSQTQNKASLPTVSTAANFTRMPGVPNIAAVSFPGVATVTQTVPVASTSSVANTYAWYDYYNKMYSQQNREVKPPNSNSVLSASEQSQTRQLQQQKQETKQPPKELQSAVSKLKEKEKKDVLETLKQLAVIAEEYKKRNKSSKKSK